MGRDSSNDVEAYGIWPWLFGLALAGFFIWLMFELAQSIS